MQNLVNLKTITQKALKDKYAIPHININNLEWTKAILETAQKLKSPIILATSKGAIKYIGGTNTVIAMVKGLIADLKITIPVVLHLDHGLYQDAIDAIDAGYTSIMYDGSKNSFEQNYQETKKIVSLAKPKNISIEAEVGKIAGDEDEVSQNLGSETSPKEAIKLANLGIDILAIGINNFHGKYPQNWKSLDFKLLKQIHQLVKIGLVLHGASGIPDQQIKKAIKLGIVKINFNTELQIANAQAILEYVNSGKINDFKNKGYDPRKIYGFGYQAICKVIEKIIFKLGSNNKAEI